MNDDISDHTAKEGARTPSPESPIIISPVLGGSSQGNNRFDPRSLRLNPNTLATGAVKKVLATVPIRKGQVPFYV